jgi:GT2 family glycosyltransferase
LNGLARALLSEDDAAEVEVVVADNGLGRGVGDALRADGAKVVEMGGNAGFGRAVNRAAAAAEGEVLVVTNDDVEPEPGFAAALAGAAVEGGMAAGVLLKPEAPGRIESAGIALDRVLGWHDHLGDVEVAALDQGPPPPFGPSGAAAAYDRELFRSAGGFDEGLFVYGEDVDLALRLRREGALCGLAGGARALHATSWTIGYASAEKARLVGHSRGYLMRKYGVLDRPLRAAQALGIELLASLLLAARHRSLAPAAARVEGWRECREREPFPPREWLTVPLLDGMGQRLAWHRRRPQR